MQTREQKDKHNERVRRTKCERQSALAGEKAQRGCARCPEKDPDCLDFHHRDKSEKKFSPGNTQLMHARPWITILEEIAKCDVLCANCHRKEEARQRREAGN